MRYEYICTDRKCTKRSDKSKPRSEWSVIELEFTSSAESKHVMCEECSGKLTKIPSVSYKKKITSPKHSGIKGM